MPGSSDAQPIKLDSHASSRRANTASARSMAVELAQMLADDKCQRVVVLEVVGLSPVTDYIVIASGTSDRQMNAVMDHALELAERAGLPAVRQARDERSTWLLADFVDVVLHLFEPQTRAHYDVESLYPEARDVRWERPDQIDRNRAGLRPDERLEP